MSTEKLINLQYRSTLKGFWMANFILAITAVAVWGYVHYATPTIVLVLTLLVCCISFAVCFNSVYRERLRVLSVLDTCTTLIDTSDLSPGFKLSNVYGEHPDENLADTDRCLEFIDAKVTPVRLQEHCTRAHLMLKLLNPQQVAIYPAKDAGYWNMIEYRFRYHDVVFFISLE